jgi:hypothetical protein
VSWALVAVALSAAGGGVAYAVSRAQEAPSGPVEVVWDKEACAHCHMHVGDPKFAAQAHVDGEVRVFDDPGCLLRWQSEDPSRARARVWMHDSDGSGWIDADHVAFARGAQSPMGYGLRAVRAGAPGAIGLEEARAEVKRR